MIMYRVAVVITNMKDALTANNIFAEYREYGVTTNSVASPKRPATFSLIECKVHEYIFATDIMKALLDKGLKVLVQKIIVTKEQ